MPTDKVWLKAGLICSTASGREQKVDVRTNPDAASEEEPMCPACIASAALTAGGVITTGGLAAAVGKVFHAIVLQPKRIAETEIKTGNSSGHTTDTDKEK